MERRLHYPGQRCPRFPLVPPWFPYDRVTKNGKTIGISTWVGYSSHEGRMLTLAILDNEHAQLHNDATFV